MAYIVFTEDIADSCKRLRAVVQRLESSTASVRFSDIRIHRKFYKMKRATDEFIEAIRRC